MLGPARPILRAGAGVMSTVERAIVTAALPTPSLAELALRLDAVAQVSRAGVLCEDGARRVVLASGKLCTLFGLAATPESLVGGDGRGLFFDARMAFKEQERLAADAERLAAAGVAATSELELADGRVFRREYRPLLEDGVLRGHLFCYEDLTEDRLALRRAERRSRLQEITHTVLTAFLEDEVLGHGADVLLAEVGALFGLSGAWLVRHSAAQTGFLATAGWRPDEALQHGEDVLVPWLDAEAFEAMVGGAPLMQPSVGALALPESLSRRLAEDGVSAALLLPVLVFGRLEGVFCFEHREQSRAWREDEVALLHSTAEGFARALERRVVERERRQGAIRLSSALSKAESASRFRAQFVSYLSHQVQRPLGAILGDADALAGAQDDALAQAEISDRIRGAVHHVLALVDDLVDLSRVELGQLELSRAPCDVAALVDDVHRCVEPRASEAAVTLEVAYPPLVPERCELDAVRLRQVLQNLCEETITLGRGGKVDVRLSFTTADEPARLELHVLVAARGAVLPAERLASLFLPFTPGLGDLRHGGGSVVGVALSRGLARLMGGELSAESTPDGTAFSLRVDAGPAESVRMVPPGPVQRERRELEPESQVLALRGRHLLVVEDSADSQRVLRFLLERAGAAVEVAWNGADGVAAARASRRAGRPFDAILLDLQMPVMDGLTAAARLRADGVEAPLLAMTVFPSEEDRARALAAGCLEVLGKPLDSAQLYAALARALAGVPFSSPRLATARPRAGERLLSELAGNPGGSLLVERYLQALPAQVAELETRLAGGEWAELAPLLHRLRLDARSHGYPAISQAAGECERLLGEASGSESLTSAHALLLSLLASALR